MELCGGGAMDSVYRGLKKPIDENVLSVIFHEAFVALQYLHTQVFIIHRDIKGGNLFLTDEGGMKLGDFGVSAQLTSPNGRARTFIGTPYVFIGIG
jgi:serine/threonine protein kinase